MLARGGRLVHASAEALHPSRRRAPHAQLIWSDLLSNRQGEAPVRIARGGRLVVRGRPVVSVSLALPYALTEAFAHVVSRFYLNGFAHWSRRVVGRGVGTFDVGSRGQAIPNWRCVNNLLALCQQRAFTCIAARLRVTPDAPWQEPSQGESPE